MDKKTSEFFVSLPSNASMGYFPHNIPSLYRTKLSTPIEFHGDWEVGLAEICLPRTWFNIGEHNNQYSILFEKEETVIRDSHAYKIKITYKTDEPIENFWMEINRKISDFLGPLDRIKFSVIENGVHLEMLEDYEILITPDEADKFLYMLHLPNERTLIKISSDFRFRPSQKSPVEIMFTVIDKTPLNIDEHSIPLSKTDGGAIPKRNRFVFDSINKTISIMGLQKFVNFNYDVNENEVTIKVENHVELHIESATFLRKLHLREATVIKEATSFKVNPDIMIDRFEKIVLKVKNYPTDVIYKKEFKNIFLKTGLYTNASDLFKSFDHVTLIPLHNLKVALDVPLGFEIRLSRGLADMLGFEKTDFESGYYESKYVLDLNASITEIFVYCNIVESHPVGDSVSPLLRIIPCINEKEEQIVKQYERPLYFPLRKKRVECVEIALRTSTGEIITFTTGKT
ncbi:hypothetical protein AVEN_218086-1 [Araneus ventricosus]|uniref:Uncharacterized protein n=1 Tax=Araneus ventricosus TaxID=182803 RepID=A0A4Y2QSU5_ARAVE|nr:hypothetical protein AVEN_218086-1 [Araneus ventricosus]